MNKIIFWICFAVILILIVWGMVVAMNKGVTVKLPELTVPVSSTDHVRGPANATVTIVEYGDFQCPACATYYPLVERLVNEASSTVRLVFRNFPLVQHKNAMSAAKAAESAAKQGKFWEMYRLLYENQAEWSDVTDTRLFFDKYSAQIGLDGSKFVSDLTDPNIDKKIGDDRSGGVDSHVDSTPTFFVNGKAIDNRSIQSYENFKKIIDDAAIVGTK